MKPHVLCGVSGRKRCGREARFLLKEDQVAEDGLGPGCYTTVGGWRDWIGRVFRPEARECLGQYSALGSLGWGFENSFCGQRRCIVWPIFLAVEG